MRIFKITVVLLSIITVSFLSLGVFVPSFEYQNSISIDATPQKCWSIFNDTSRMKEWMEGFESLTLKSGQINQPGAVFEIIIQDPDKRYVMSEQLKTYEPPTKIVYELTNDVLKSEYEFTFEGTDKTTATSRYRITGNNLIWKSILFLSKSYMSEQGQKQLTGLKEAVE